MILMWLSLRNFAVSFDPHAGFCAGKLFQPDLSIALHRSRQKHSRFKQNRVFPFEKPPPVVIRRRTPQIGRWLKQSLSGIAGIRGSFIGQNMKNIGILKIAGVSESQSMGWQNGGFLGNSFKNG